MKFTRLRVAGFKSFVDPTELMIEPGITGIVGPNGCGKSNIVEALRWVMGESSAKRMRGGEMDDVIFSGTSARPIRNLAEVSLLIDNAERSAPAAFNELDELEVTRRIEREQGSRYLISGDEVRMRDVQLLFADAKSGANSTAIVSQGQIGAIINAKPQQRRGILEEAAGIRGLHSRRHEAELRLRAAETNIERLDDVVQTLGTQLQGLKRQARQASRFRNISGHIRGAEAILLHLKWVAAAAEVDGAQTALAAAEKEVAERTARAAAASTAQAKAGDVLPALREAEAAAAASLHRLSVARDNLEAEELKAREQMAQLGARVAQVDADTEREQAQAQESQANVSRLVTEIDALGLARNDEADARRKAEAEASELASEVGTAESALQTLTERHAVDEVRRHALSDQVRDLATRAARLTQRLAELRGETGAARSEGQPASSPVPLTLAAAQGEAERSEARSAEAAGDEENASSRLRELEAEAMRLRAEADGLAKLLRVNEDDLWPPLIDSVSVKTGYEAALGAALGDDLGVSTDTGAPAHWQTANPAAPPPPLPGNAIPLGRFVTGPAPLSLRLSQVGVVGADEGPDLARDLVQGQRLVTTEGELWRWDGFTVRAEAATPATTRLSQRNRLERLRAQAADRDAVAAETQDAFEMARQRAAAAAETARIAAERAQRLALLEASEADLGKELEEVTGQRRHAAELLAGLASGEALRREIETARPETEGLRRRFAVAEARRETLDQEAEARAERIAALEADRGSWLRQGESATAQIEALAQRRAETLDERARLEARPAEIESERGRLLSAIESAERERQQAADSLAEAESTLADRDKALKQAQDTHAEARETRVRLESNFEIASQGLNGVASAIREKLDCTPQEALSKSGHKEGKELPDLDSIEARLERLRRERERMGPVNLRADIEAAEIMEQVETLQTERHDLEGAIARLRRGIQSLNREGRERLLASFNEVNTHFRELFERLFGGGRAHLALTESDDPLEAGLEIMASPPGKRLQTMSLLSGGEKALTAISLLFAVFMTNPAPICVLDEVDAPLDGANVERFCDLVRDIAANAETRFLIITHNSITMAQVDRLYGVTMEEPGVSQLVSVDLSRAERIRDTA